MKTIKYLLIPALTGLLFTACNTEVKGPSQAELDTQVEAKLKSAVDQLKSDCDSRILQAAQTQADSMLAKAAKKAPANKVSAPAPVVKKTEKPKPAPAPVKTNPKADRFNNNGGKTVTKEDTKQKEARFENEGKKEVTPEDTKKKADRFKK
jgi:hypothetical protein